MKTKEETLKKVISESDYFISEDHWVWTIAIKAMEEYARENLREELIKFKLKYDKLSPAEKCTVKVVVSKIIEKHHRYCFDVIYQQDHIITKKDRLSIWLLNLFQKYYPKYRMTLYDYDNIKYQRYKYLKQKQ